MFYLRIICVAMLSISNFYAFSTSCGLAFNLPSLEKNPLLTFVKKQFGPNWQNKVPDDWVQKIDFVDQRQKERKSIHKRRHSLNLFYYELSELLILLEKRISEQNLIKNILEHPSSFSYFNLEYTKKRIAIFEEILTSKKVDKLLKQHLRFFVEPNFYKKHLLVRSDFGKDNREFDENLHEDSINNSKKIIQSVKHYVGKASLEKVINKSFSVFFSVHMARNFNFVAKYIEKHIGKEGVKQKIMNSLAQFSRPYVTLSQLKYLESQWGAEAMKTNLQQYSLFNVIFQFTLSQNKQLKNIKLKMIEENSRKRLKLVRDYMNNIELQKNSIKLGDYTMLELIKEKFEEIETFLYSYIPSNQKESDELRQAQRMYQNLSSSFRK